MYDDPLHATIAPKPELIKQVVALINSNFSIAVYQLSRYETKSINKTYLLQTLFTRFTTRLHFPPWSLRREFGLNTRRI